MLIDTDAPLDSTWDSKNLRKIFKKTKRDKNINKKQINKKQKIPISPFPIDSLSSLQII
jgi:hypothetical protein